MNKLLITLFSFLAIAVVSCSDDDEPKMPTNAIALNMMIGDSETTIGRQAGARACALFLYVELIASPSDQEAGRFLFRLRHDR